MDQVDDEHPELGRKENSLKWPHMERVTRITKPYFNGRTPENREEKENVHINILGNERRKRICSQHLENREKNET